MTADPTLKKTSEVNGDHPPNQEQAPEKHEDVHENEDDPEELMFADTMDAPGKDAKPPEDKEVPPPPPVKQEPAFPPVSDSLTNHSVKEQYRDGLSDKILVDVAEAMTLAPDNPIRQQLVKNLVDRFDKPATYAEKIAAARSLLLLQRGADGSTPDIIAQRDVFIPEKTRYIPASGGGRGGGTPARTVVEKAQHHELLPVRSSELLQFLERSAPEIQARTAALLKTPFDSDDRKSYVKHLVNVFQTSGEESQEKLAAAKALTALCSKPDGSMPDLLGTRDVYHAKVTHQVGGGRGGSRTVTDKEAYTESINTTAQQVRGYLDGRADGYLRRTQEALQHPENETQKKELIAQAIKTFLDSRDPQDRAAAANALLALNRKPDGSYNENLGARVVPIPAETRYIPASGGGRGGGTPARTEIVKPASERTDTVKLADVVQFLKWRAADAESGTGRLVAADALVRANKMTETERKAVYEQTLTDAKTPEHVKAHVREVLGLDKKDAEKQRETDGRVEKLEIQPQTIKISDELKTKLATTIERVLPAVTAAGGADGKSVILPETIKAMKDEMARNEFGPASRAVYNHCANFLNVASTDMATALTDRNIALPPGCPISVPRDVSGRAENDQLFKQELKSGHLKMDLKPLANNEAPSLADAERIKNTGEWTTKAARLIDSVKLHWQVNVFDRNIEEFNTKDDKLKAWKSKDGMSDKQLEQLQAARAEWLGMALQVRNYAHTIASYNKASVESTKAHSLFWNTMPTSITGSSNGIFSDEALQNGKFPGTVHRVDGKITGIELDLPSTLDRDNPENLAKMEKIRQWMETYGKKVDQATTEIAKANNQPERMLFWGDLPLPKEEKDAEGKPFNQVSFRFSASTVRAKDEKGDMQTMIRVVNSKQNEYAPGYSYLGLFDYEVGKAQHTGKVMINGQPIENLRTETSVGKAGQIKVDGPGVEDKHCLVKTDENGQIYLKDNSESGTFVNGKRISKDEWRRINPVSDTVTFGPEPTVDIQAKDGNLTVNGQRVEKNMEGIAVGKNGPIKFDGPTAEDNHALIRFDQGKVFIKDTSKSGTFVNGVKISKENWTEIDPEKDKVSLGQATRMEADSDVRLYKPDDWVTINLDGKMQLLQAKDLNFWANEAKAWHYGGKGATLAMDVGMVVSGTIELKGAIMAAQKTAAAITCKELAKLTAKEVLPVLMKTEGFKRGAFHFLMGMTGFTHQFMENQGEWGKGFNKVRAYTMMADISWNTLAKPLGARVFGAGKAAEAVQEGSSVAAYLKEAPKWVKNMKAGTDATFFASNFYFIPEIISHQLPAIEKQLRGWDSEALILQGRRQRGGEYVGDDKRPPATEDRALQFASPELKKRAAESAELAKKTAELKDDDPKKEEQRRKFAADYLDAKNDDDKMVAAVGLLNLARRADGGYPDSLGDRYKRKGALPDEVKLANVKNFLASKELDSINAFDKQAKSSIEELQKQVALVKNSPENDPARQLAVAKFADAFTNGKTSNDKLAGALALISLAEKDGNLPAVLGRMPDGKGGLQEVKKEQVEAFLNGLNKQFAVDQYDRYAKWMETTDGGKMAAATSAALKLPASDPQRVAQINALADVVKNSSNAKAQAEASVALLMLSRNTENGSLPKKLAGDLTTENVFKKLKENIAELPPGMRLAAGDLLYRAGQKSLHGQAPVNDLGGILLSVLKDPQASDQLKMQAILNSNGIGLAEIMEKHRFEDEPTIERLKGLDRLKAQADLSGRDSMAVQEALKTIAGQPINGNLPAPAQAQQRDLKALALATLMANGEPNPEKRLKALETLHAEFGQNQGEAGAYAKKYFERMRDTLSIKGDGSTERLARFQAALVLKTSGQADALGVSEKQLFDVFFDSVRPNEPELAQQAFEHVLPHFNNANLMSKEKQERLLEHISYALKSTASDPLSSADALRRDWIGRISELAKKTDADKVLNGFKNDMDEKKPGAREIFARMLTPGTMEFKGATAESRAAAAKALGEVGSNDLATRKLLKKSLGLEGAAADPSALVRNAAFDTLVKLNPPGLRDTCLDLLRKETDPELLRRIKGIETGERRLDPSSQEYQERFRVALRELLTSNKRSLVGSEEFIKTNFPLLDGLNLRKEEVAGHIEKYYKDFGGFLNWATSCQSTIDAHEKSEIERVGREMNTQFDNLINQAKTAEGDQARRALAWIVMSNAKCFSMSEKEDGVKRAAAGLLDVAQNGSPEAKAGIAPLITMCLTTQDRMPFSARIKVLDALEALSPGAKGSPISADDAGIAALAALRRQFHNTPAADGSPRYSESHELQRRLLNTCGTYLKQEGIPILEAIAEEKTKSKITRDADEQVTTVNYADKSSRTVARDQDGKIWKDTFTSADGKTTTMIREGKSDLWYASTDKEKKNPWRGQPYFENDTGNYVRKDAYGNESVTTPSGARAERKDGVVSKVLRADGTTYELLYRGGQSYQSIVTDKNGAKTVWTRDENTDRWYADTDKARKEPWYGSSKFDSKTLDYIDARTDGSRTRILSPDGGVKVIEKGDITFSGPGMDDNSTHVMPGIRDKAREILARVRDDTADLRNKAAIDGQASPQNLAAKLQSVLNNKESTSEDVVKAIFSCAMSKPIDQADDPRRAVLQGLLNDPHERIQLAAARMLFSSALKEDRERAAEVLADLQKNASRIGYRKDAQALTDDVKANPAKFREGDAQLLKDALDRVKTHAQPRAETAPPRILIDRPIEHQEAYEIAKAEMLRDSQRPLAKFSGQDWWKKNGYELLDERNLPEANRAAIKSVEPGFFKFWTSWESTLKKERDDALAAVGERYNQQYKNLLSAAEKEGTEGVEAREALSYIVLSQGEPFDPNNRDAAMKVAASKLAEIYRKGGPNAGDIEWTIKAALVANPNIPRGVRDVLAAAVVLRYVDELDGKIPPGRMTRSEVSTLVVSTLEAEYMAMPQPGQAGYKDSVELQKGLLGLTEALGDRLSMPVVEALSQGHPDAEMREKAQAYFEKMRDSVRWVARGVVPDVTTSNQAKADILKEVISAKKIDDEFAVRELYRLCPPGSLPIGQAALDKDPRKDVLLEAMKSPNERVKYAAAAILVINNPDVNSIAAIAETAEYTKRPGLKKEANALLDSAIKSANANAVMGMAEAILRHKGESKDLLAMLQDNDKTKTLPLSCNFPDGRQVVVRRMEGGGTLIEQFRDGKLEKFVAPPGKTYSQVLLQDSGNYRLPAQQRAQAAYDALMKPEYGKMSSDERDKAIRNLGWIVADTKTDEKTRLSMAKFLGSEKSLVESEAAAARVKAFDAIVDLAAHGKDTKAEAKKIITADASAEMQAMRTLYRALSALNPRADRAKELVAENMQLQAELFRADNNDREALFYSSIMAAEKVVGSDDPAITAAAAVIDRTSKDHKLRSLAGNDDSRIPALHLALSSGNNTVSASAALALLDTSLKPDTVADVFKAAAREPMIRHTQALFRRATEIEDKKDPKQTLAAWTAVEDTLKRTGENPENFSYVYATMKRMSAELGPTNKELAPLYEKLAKHFESGENPERAAQYRQKERECLGLPATDAAKPKATPPATPLPANVEKRMTDVLAAAKEATSNGDVEKMKATRKDLVELADTLRKSEGKSSLRLAGVLSQMGSIMMKTGSEKDGEAALKESAQIYEASGTERLPEEAVDNLLGLSRYYAGTGNTDAFKEYQGKMLNLSKMRGYKTIEAKTPQAFTELADFVALQSSEKDAMNEAETMLKEAERLTQQRTGPISMDSALATRKLADFYMKPGNPNANGQKAEALLQKSLKTMEMANPGQPGEEWAVTKAKVAHCYSMRGEYQMACAQFGQAMDAMMASPTPVDQAKFAEVTKAYAEVLSHTPGRMQEAGELLRDPAAYRARQRQMPQGPNGTMGGMPGGFPGGMPGNPN